jgi:pyridoxal 5'-phosphate synthase pdxT subunit
LKYLPCRRISEWRPEAGKHDRMKTTIGILALQGDFAKHQQAISTLGYFSTLVRTSAELKQCSGLIIPGGESSTMTKLLLKHGLWDELQSYASQNPVFGTCAGLIILAAKIQNESQHVQTLAVLDITVQRNAYGRQIDSFIDELEMNLNGKTEKIQGIFIRAPKILAYGADVIPKAWHKKQVVMVERNNIMAATFHPELAQDFKIHRYFVDKVLSSSTH